MRLPAEFLQTGSRSRWKKAWKTWYPAYLEKSAARKVPVYTQALAAADYDAIKKARAQDERHRLRIRIFRC